MIGKATVLLAEQDVGLAVLADQATLPADLVRGIVNAGSDARLQLTIVPR
jgi:hypothetical protein